MELMVEYIKKECSEEHGKEVKNDTENKIHPL